MKLKTVEYVVAYVHPVGVGKVEMLASFKKLREAREFCRKLNIDTCISYEIYKSMTCSELIRSGKPSYEEEK